MSRLPGTLKEVLSSNGGSVSYIPTITGKFCTPSTDIALCSATKKNGLRRGKLFTIVDCHTFYLRSYMRDRAVAVDHYVWFSEFAHQNNTDESLIFVAPDFDWLGDESTEQLAALWPTNLNNQLVVSGSRLASIIKEPLGYAFSTGVPRKVPDDIEWVHHFSKYYESVDNKQLLQTYDSVSSQ